jgi:hypothetical protein
LTNYYTHNQLHQQLHGCNSSSEQTKHYTIVGAVDYRCNSSLEQTKRLYNCWCS